MNFSTTTNSAFWINEVQAIATMWEAAGIKVNIQDYSLQQMLGITFSGSWQAIDENWGPSVNPTINDGQFFKGGTYSIDVNAPVPDAEKSNPLFSGCFDRNA